MKKTPNQQQAAVIADIQSNLLLFASAGTGKTFTLASRIARILQEGAATEQEILCLTFTIKACKELKEDVAAQIEGADRLAIYTVHGFCYALLQEEARRTGKNFAEFGVCDEVDQEEILQTMLSTRFAVWRLEKACEEAGLPPPDFEKTPLYQAEGLADVVWKVGDRLLTLGGGLFSAQEYRQLTLYDPPCPVCGKNTAGAWICPNCGQALSLRLPERQFPIYSKRTALRNFVSELKHLREKLALYSGDAQADYQAAFAYLEEKMPSTFAKVTSYYAPYLGAAPDEEFIQAMRSFAGRLAAEYDEYLFSNNLLDFDDLILKANALLRTEEGLAYWSQKYAYILVDEMQDTSLLEYDLLKKLFVHSKSMLCGDIFQTIYSWRGSNPDAILEDYLQTFSPKTYTLSENYRSTKTLVEAANGYLQNTYPTLMGKYSPKTLQIHSEEEGEKIFCYAFDNAEEEARQIYKYLCKHKPQQPLDTCVIARSNKYIAELSAYFSRFDRERQGKDGLRFFTVEENFQFFKKAVVKDVLAILKLLVLPADRGSMERIAQKFIKQIGAKTIEYFRTQAALGAHILAFIDPQTYAYNDPYFRLLEGYAQGNFVVYDTETTGLDVEKDEIVQLSAIKIGRGGEILDSLDILVEPTRPIERAAQQTHGFTLESIRARGGVTAKQALAQFSAFAEGSVLIGHNNLAFDKPLLERQYQENGLQFPQILAEYDTLLIAKQFYPELDNFKLATLCARFSVTNERAHDALSDVTATGQCLAAMLENAILPTTSERSAIFAKYKGKFEKFFAFTQELRRCLEQGKPFAERIVEGLMLKKKYPTHTDLAAMRDIVESLEADCPDKKAFLRGYLRDAALAGSQMDILIKKSNRIPVITVHQAKGCEFDTVVLAGADDRNFPSYAATQTGGEEEEKKVFYVAMTRAKRRLILTRALRKGRYDVKETPYFWKIPEKFVRTNAAWRNGD